LSQHLKAFPDYEENLMLVESRIMLVGELAPPRLVPLLEEMAKSPSPEIVELAQSRLTMAKTLAELKSKPLDLKFKAFDETEVDLEKLRGKVVLVDFWATWCGPCMIELPKVVRAYGKLKEKGFEIIGISLDEDEAELKRVLKAKQITWPQYFDGKGWENPYAKKYGVDGIPAMWLVNKKGMVVDIQAQDDLEAKIEKLLAE
jgi:thiol-disulfide isomerase/thioredoxin